MKLPVIHTIGHRPEPLLTRATVTSAVTGLTSALISFGVLPAALGDQISAAAKVVIGCVFTTIAVIAPIVQAISSRKVVTPISDPHDSSGRPLEPAAAADAEAARAVTSLALALPAGLDDTDLAPLAAIDDLDPADDDYQDTSDVENALAEADALFPAAEDDDPAVEPPDDASDARPQPHRPRHLED